MTQANIIALALAPFIMWRIYKRVQRLTTRQQSHMWRHKTGTILFPLVLALMAGLMIAKPLALAGIAVGAATGVTVALIALRRTQFERIGNDFFYTPHAPIGLAIAMLFIGRVLYRGYEMVIHGPQQVPDFGSSPATLMIFGTVFGYYTAYTVGLLRWRRAQPLLESKE